MKTKLKSLLRCMQRWWYKQAVYTCMEDDINYGKFRVKYPNGNKSIKMCYKNAENYAEIFGGEVVDDF